MKDVRIGDCVGKELEICLPPEDLQEIIWDMEEIP